MKKSIFTGLLTVLSLGMSLGTMAFFWQKPEVFVWPESLSVFKPPSRAPAALGPHDMKLSGGKPSIKNLDQIEISVHSLRSDKGQVIAVLYSNPKNFPDSPEDVKQIVSAPTKKDGVTLVFSNVPAGDYAVVLLHDEDSSGDMKKGAFGLPLEGYGFSNDAPIFMSPPKYEASHFIKSDGLHRINVKMRYFSKSKVNE